MIRIVSVFLICIFIFGCSQDGLHKTEFNEWEETHLKKTRLNLELPRSKNPFSKPYYINELYGKGGAKKGDYWEATIGMHPLQQGSLLTEPFYLINITIARLSGDNYSEYMNNEHILASYDIFREDRKGFQEQLESYEIAPPPYSPFPNGNILILRKDYKSQKGDYIITGASLYTSTQNISDSDIEAVKRILNSVKPL